MSAMRSSVSIVNLNEATFECTFGRGCDGICCRHGRPPVYPDEAQRITANLAKFLPSLRPQAHALVLREGYLSRRRRFGQPLMRVVNGWCVFFNRGCVLHQVGAAEGDRFQYKPSVCSVFPLQNDVQGRWHVRQKGFKREQWDLFCLDPNTSAVPAAKSLVEEITLAERLVEEAEANVEVQNAAAATADYPTREWLLIRRFA